MHGRLFHNEKYLEQLIPKIQNLNNEHRKSLFCGLAVPNPYLFQFSNRLIDCDLHLGVQDVSSENSDGAFTGDISAEMFKEFNCSFVIIGHSERRSKYLESDKSLLKKVKVSIKNDILPIICVGETLKNREKGNHKSIISKQINCFTSGLNEDDLSKCIFAYEPLWAIGTGKNAAPSDAESMHQLIKLEFEKVVGKNALEKIKVLYGGSVKAENAEQYFRQPSIDGALIGGASLDAIEFSKIIDKGHGHYSSFNRNHID